MKVDSVRLTQLIIMGKSICQIWVNQLGLQCVSFPCFPCFQQIHNLPFQRERVEGLLEDSEGLLVNRIN